MSVCIVGGGCTGLATAIKIKIKNPKSSICIIDSSRANTQIAGMRVRTRGSKTGSIAPNSNSFLEELALKNDGIITPGMRTLAERGISEILFWQELLTMKLGSNGYADNPSWFGPQLGAPNHKGKGHGNSFISILRQIAKSTGVQFISGQINNVEAEDNHITWVEGTESTTKLHFQLRASQYIFSGGDPAGSMFFSTNKDIPNTPAELLLKHGVTLTGSSEFMIHPFGNASTTGAAKIGCYQTDDLTGAKVLLQDASGDFSLRARWVEELLLEHQAHYHFDEISAYFNRHGDHYRIIHDDGNVSFGRPSHHFSHMGLATDEDMISITKFENALGGGDSVSIGRYTGYKQRLPGVGITAALLDAELISEKVVSNRDAEGAIIRTNLTKSATPKRELNESNALKTINTHGLFQVKFGNAPISALSTWRDELRQHQLTYGTSTPTQLSLLTVSSLGRRYLLGEQEPIPVSNLELLETKSELHLPIS